MRTSLLATCLTVVLLAVHTASVPEANAIERAVGIEKRKGGGGGGKGGGSGGRSSGSSPPSRTSTSSNLGGTTRYGSGPSRAYGNGGYYGGGSSRPYSAGSPTPMGLLAGTLIAPLLLFEVFPGLWPYGAYPYYYNNPYRFYNQSAQNETNPNGMDLSLPVLCLCQEYSVCGCDENDDPKYLNDLVGNGSYTALNKTLLAVSDVNGTQTLVVNGTLPNGTTAPGGTEEAMAIRLVGGKYAWFWVIVLVVLYTVAFI